MDIVVGIDGRAHDAKVVRSLGKDLDEKAIETVKRWRFEPAVKDDQTFETPLRVSMSFRTIPIN